MRARLVFEKFAEKSDPIKDLGIGYKKRILESHTWKILEFIKSKGEEGASLTEIQRYIWVDLEKKDPEEFEEKQYYRGYDYKRGETYPTMIRKTRGHWNTALYGGYNYQGILHGICRKNPKTKKWVFERFPRPDERLYYK